MDFVVVGFGLGALILLVGIAVRDLAPRLRRSDAPEPTGDRLLDLYSIQRVPVARWADACQRAARTIMFGGGAIVLAAVGGIVAGVDNGDGARLVLAVILIVFGGIVVQLGLLANELFPMDRRSRERARQLMQRAMPVAATVAEAPKAETAAKPDEAKPETPLVAAEVAADIEPNGTSSEAIPAAVEVEQAEAMATSGAGEDGGESTAIDKGDAAVVENESPVAEAGADIGAARETAAEVAGDAADQAANDVVGAGADGDERAVDEAAPESQGANEDETDEAAVPSDVAASG